MFLTTIVGRGETSRIAVDVAASGSAAAQPNFSPAGPNRYIEPCLGRAAGKLVLSRKYGALKPTLPLQTVQLAVCMAEATCEKLAPFRAVYTGMCNVNTPEGLKEVAVKINIHG